MPDEATRAGGEPPAEETVPAASEHVHLPGPSFLPVLVALGVTLALVGVVFNVVVLVLGLAITLVATIRWVRETRADMSELPLDH